MLVIRLTRTGKPAQESFRIVVAEQAKAVKRQYVELLGHYHPATKDKAFTVNKDRVLYWISKGAQPSETVASLLKAEGVTGMEKYIHFKTDRKAKRKKGGDEPAAPTEKAEAPAEAAPQA
ncbi:30S ribosomal protein S16 [Candidatus Peregrinibacteria bacterium]|nr:30S ribosomal protein S16 [Candidatus Peregrinibacteria bacterium]